MNVLKQLRPKLTLLVELILLFQDTNTYRATFNPINMSNFLWFLHFKVDL